MSTGNLPMKDSMMRHLTMWFLSGIRYAAALGRGASFSAQVCAQGTRVRANAPIFVGVQGSSVPIVRRRR
jgi:hypothetical protein